MKMEDRHGYCPRTPSVTQSKALPTKPVSVDAVPTKLTCTFHPGAAMCPTPTPAPIQSSLDPTSPQLPAHPPRTSQRPGPSTCTHRPPGSSLHAHPSRWGSASEQDLLPQLPVPPRGSRRVGRRSLWRLQTPAQSRDTCKERAAVEASRQRGRARGASRQRPRAAGPRDTGLRPALAPGHKARCSGNPLNGSWTHKGHSV